MSKSPKNSEAGARAAEVLPFEEAMKRLETIVEAMESGDLPLETLLVKFEEGKQLAKVCQDRLNEAGQKIQQLEKDQAGEFQLTPVNHDEDKALP